MRKEIIKVRVEINKIGNRKQTIKQQVFEKTNEINKTD